MIHRYYKDGEQLDVAGLNQITVLLDRSETELTEIGWNQWRAGLEGPPHKHDDKEQLFYVTSGVGVVTVGKEDFVVKPGNLIYVPAGVVHRTNVTGGETLAYILFNIFLGANKEGHATFAEHIEKMKSIRRQQADTGRADVDDSSTAPPSVKKGKFIANVYDAPRFEFGSNSTLLLLDRPETSGFETVVVQWPPHSKGALVAHKEKEQAFFVLSGKGRITVGDQTEAVKTGDLVYVPRNTPHTTEAGEQELSYLCLNCYVTASKDKSFAEMFARIAPGRIKRWKSGDEKVGE